MQKDNAKKIAANIYTKCRQSGNTPEEAKEEAKKAFTSAIKSSASISIAR